MLKRGPQDISRRDRLQEKVREDYEFEAIFFEGLLARRPDYWDALQQLAHIYTELGFYESGYKLDQKLCQNEPKNPVCCYNLACSMSLTGRIKDALTTLKLACQLGYDDNKHIACDPDLKALQSYQEFQELCRDKSV